MTNLYHNHQPLKSVVPSMPTILEDGQVPPQFVYFFLCNYANRTTWRGIPLLIFLTSQNGKSSTPPSVLSTQLDERGGFNPSPYVFNAFWREWGWFNPSLCFSHQCGWFYPFRYILGAFRRGSTHPRISLMCLDANREGYDPSLCVFDVINANTTTTTKLTPFVGYYCTPGGGREERLSCLYVHHFFLSFFKNLFGSCNEGFPSQCLYKTYVEGQW